MNANTIKKIGLLLGPVVALIILLLDLSPGNPIPTRMASVAVLMAIWWMTEAVPISATALLPLVLFPVFGIQSAKITAPSYFNSIIFLFIGGFIIALAMEKWNLHKRISLFIVKAIGGSSTRIIIGFMLASAFLSMFISNTATTIMMLPIAMSVIKKLEETHPDKTRKFSIALLLGIAYSASVGGVATIVGTPPNIAFVSIFSTLYPNAPEISFGTWFMMGLPLSIFMLTVVWFVLNKIFYKPNSSLVFPKEVISSEYKKLGKMTKEEKLVLYVFAATALLWMFRADISLGSFVISGWSNFLANPKMIDDGHIAITMAMFLFILPSAKSNQKILDKDIFKKIPWDILLLFGGGFALAKGFKISGLSEIIGSVFSGLQDTPLVVLSAAVSACLTFLTELTSNTATTQTLLPILSSASDTLNVNPLLLMIPATLSASFAFMLPVATPPNAIVFASGKINIRDMVKAGFLINIIGIFVVLLIFYAIGIYVFNIDLSVFPNWN